MIPLENRVISSITFSLSSFSLVFVLVASVQCNFRRARSRYSLWQNDGGVNFLKQLLNSMYLDEEGFDAIFTFFENVMITLAMIFFLNRSNLLEKIEIVVQFFFHIVLSRIHFMVWKKRWKSWNVRASFCRRM